MFIQIREVANFHTQKSHLTYFFIMKSQRLIFEKVNWEVSISSSVI
jgi:hypothetical protein